MIPKKIHYCWFGGNPLPKQFKKYIDGWRRLCPDYEIIEWNESNFDVNMNAYVKQAYEAKKYAFVSDFARFYILYNHGGIYFDTDVEMIKPIDDLLENRMFTGIERPDSVATGLALGGEAGTELFSCIIKEYEKRCFITEEGEQDTETVCKFITRILVEHGYVKNGKDQMVDGMRVYPKEYFGVNEVKNGQYVVTENSYTIHHYAASWESKGFILKRKVTQWMIKVMGTKNYDRLLGLKHKLEGGAKK